MTRQNGTRQDKRKQGKTNEDKVRQSKQCKTNEDKKRQSEQGKTKMSRRTKENKAGQKRDDGCRCWLIHTIALSHTARTSASNRVREA